LNILSALPRWQFIGWIEFVSGALHMVLLEAPTNSRHPSTDRIHANPVAISMAKAGAGDARHTTI
jgi:hypothetical protein